MTSSTPSLAPRLQGIDSLRGVLACGVMAYHYLLWTSLSVGATGDRIFGAIGIYAVEAFFVISGMSLAFAYRRIDFGSLETLGNFAIRRFFRIAPLFYLVLVATLALKAAAVLILHDPRVALPSLSQLLGNLSLLFGLTGPEQSLVIAGWSIGVEMVFYLLFPALAWTFRRGNAVVTGLICGIVAGIGTLFCTVLLSEQTATADQWACYANVANHLPFFVAGMLLAESAVRWTAGPPGPSARRSWTVGLLITLPLLFAAISATTRQDAALVCGWRRAVLSCLTIGIVWLVAICPESGGWARALGRRMGDYSFAVYLTHFLNFTVLQQVLPRQSPLLLISASALSTALTSAMVFRWVETPMIAVGKRLAQSWTAAIAPRDQALPVDAGSAANSSVPSRRAA